MKLWPSLRRGDQSPAAAQPPSSSEQKLLLSDYYSGLVQLGIDPGDRTKEWSVERAVEEGYERIIWVYKAVDAIATSASRLPFRLRDGDQVLADHPLYRILNKRANPLETGRQFRERLSSQVLLSKRGAFVELTTSRAGTPVRADLLPPGRTKPVPGKGADLLSHFQVRSIDGVKTRDVPLERVRWVRKPHPTDPYSGVTPLEAAGISAELDHNARLYNVSFLKNDGRPGVLVAVKGDADETVLRSIEQKIDQGPRAAGKTTAITADGIETIDMTSRPRDMQYTQLSKNSRQELLSAFGTPESVLGNASERTFANAEAELYAFWTITMPPHLDLLITAFDEDTEDRLEGFFDVSGVEVLQRTAIARREEARAEVAAGLRSIWSYGQMADLGDEIEDTPKTRALWVSAGKQPIPSRTQDEEAEKAADPDTAATERLVADLVTSAATTNAEADASDAADVAAEAPEAPAEPAADGVPADTGAPAAPGAKSAAEPVLVPPAPVLPPLPEARMRLVVERKADDWTEYTPDQAARDQLEADVAAALQALAVRWIERTASKLDGPKARKGTRHWEPQPGYEVDTRVGIKALDPAVAIDPEKWSAEAQEAVNDRVSAAAVVAAAAIAGSLADDEDDPAVAAAAAGTALVVLAAVGTWAARQATALTALVNGLDQDGLPLGDIVTAVRGSSDRLASWADGAAASVATATTEGAAYSTIGRIATERAVGRRAVTRQWFSRRDDRVRHDHQVADGQLRALLEPFDVGGAKLRYPGDPRAPVAQTANCRCFLRYRTARGTFARPAGPGDPAEKAWSADTSPMAAIDPEHAYAAAGPLADSAVDWRGTAAAVGRSPAGDDALAMLLAEQGFDGPPMVVDADGLDGLERAGWRRVWRGVASETDGDPATYLDDWAVGGMFPGLGVAANGVYTADRREIAEAYAGEDGVVFDLAVDPAAAVVDAGTLAQEASTALDAIRAELEQVTTGLAEQLQGASSVGERDRVMDAVVLRQRQLRAKAAVLADPGRYAVTRGYDVIRIVDSHSTGDDDTYFVVLNRTATAVRYP